MPCILYIISQALPLIHNQSKKKQRIKEMYSWLARICMIRHRLIDFVFGHSYFNLSPLSEFS